MRKRDYGSLNKVFTNYAKMILMIQCHEHIEYYALKQIQWICNNTNLKIIDIEKTNANGGSILIKCSHKNSKYKPNNRKINNMLKSEKVLD